MIDPDSILEGEGGGGGGVDAFLEEILNISGGSLQDLGEGGVEMGGGVEDVEKVPDENLEGEQGGKGLDVEMQEGVNGGDLGDFNGGEENQVIDGGEENQVEMDGGVDDVEEIADVNLEEEGKNSTLEGAANEGFQTGNLESEQIGGEGGKDSSLEGVNPADDEDFQTADEAERSDLSLEAGLVDKLEKKTETETEDKGVNRTAVNLFIPRLPIFGRIPQLAQELSNVAKALEAESSGKPSPTESDADKQDKSSPDELQMEIPEGSDDKQVEPDSTTPPHIDDLNESAEDSRMSIGSAISEEMQETLDESALRDDLETSKDETEQESLSASMDESATQISELDQGASDNSEIDRTISDLVSSIVSTCAESEESMNNSQTSAEEAAAENTEAPTTVNDQLVSNCDEPSFEEVMSILTSLDAKTSENISENLSLNEKTDMSYDHEALDSSEIIDDTASSKVPENLEVPISQKESETETVDEMSPNKNVSSKGGEDVISDDKSDGKADEMEDDERSIASLVIDEEDDQVSSTSENINDQDRHPIPSALPEKDAVIGDVSDSDLHKDSPDSAETQIVEESEMDEHDLTDTNHSEVNQEQSTEGASQNEKDDHDGPFECEVCQRPFYRLDDALKCAKFSHNPDKIRSQLFPYACSQCPDTLGFESVLALQKHWEDEHNHTFEQSSESQASDDKSEEANGEASNSLKSKKDADSKKDKHLHICTICGEQLRSNYELNLHIKEEHGRKKKETVYNFSCNKCPEKFKLRIELMRHYNQKHLKQSRVQRLRESRKAKMDQKASEARAESNKKLAMNIQSAIKGVRQSRSQNSKTDQESNEKLGLKIYKCNLCPSGEQKAFKTFRSLQTHKRFAHRNDPKWRQASPENEKRVTVTAAEYRKITRNPGLVRVVDCTKEEKKKEAERKDEKKGKSVVENLERLGKTTSDFQQQLNALKEMEEKKQLYRCETCGLFFRKMKKLIRHERSHEPSPAENEKKRPSVLEKINNVFGGKSSSSALIGGPVFKSALTMVAPEQPRPRGRPRKRDSAIDASSDESSEKMQLGRLRRISSPASSKPSPGTRRSRSRKGNEDEAATSSSGVSAQPNTKEAVVRIRKVDDSSPKPIEEKETVIKYQCSACRKKFAQKNSIYTHLSQNGKCRKRGGMPSLVSSQSEASDEDEEAEPGPSSLSKSRRNRPGPASYKMGGEKAKKEEVIKDSKTGRKERPGPASKKNLAKEKVTEAKMDTPNKVLRKDRPGPASKKVEKVVDASTKVAKKDRPGPASKKAAIEKEKEKKRKRESDDEIVSDATPEKTSRRSLRQRSVEKVADTSNKVAKKDRPGPASKKDAFEKEKKRKRESDVEVMNVATPEMTSRRSLRQKSVEKVDTSSNVKRDRPRPASKKAVFEKEKKRKRESDAEVMNVATPEMTSRRSSGPASKKAGLETAEKVKKRKPESDSDFEVISFSKVTPEMPSRRSLRQSSKASSEVVVLEEIVKSDSKVEKRKEKKLRSNEPGTARRSGDDSGETLSKRRASEPESAKKKSNKEAKEAEPESKIELSNIARKFSTRTRTSGSASKNESPKIVEAAKSEGRSEKIDSISSKRNRSGPASWKGKDLQAKEAEAIAEISNDAETPKRTRGRPSLIAAEKDKAPSKVEKKAGQATTPALKEVKIYLKRCDEPKRKRGRDEVKSDKGKAKRRKMDSESPAVLEKSKMYLFKRTVKDVVGFSKAVSSKGEITITPKRKSSERQRKSSSKIEEEEAKKGPSSSEKSRKRVAEPERSEREEVKKRRTDRTSEKSEKKRPSPKNDEEFACKVCKRKFEKKRDLLKHLSSGRCGEKRKTRRDSTESSPRTRGRPKK